MLFNSFHFAVFFPVVCVLYFWIDPRHRNLLLLVASYYFYMCWKPEYLFLILLSTTIDYIAGLRMAAAKDRAGRRFYLALSLISNLGILFGFKYFNFFAESWNDLQAILGGTVTISYSSLLLPVGISFYTFQTLSYSIDVYRGECPAEHRFTVFALYVSFFPQLVAGPIERSSRLLPQFKQINVFEYDRVTDGLKLMAWGFFKKLVIADRLAPFVDQAYNFPGGHGAAAYIIATVFFSFQIYCDFSGYSDIAIGCAQVLGYDLMDNFKRPYFSKSIAEFWRRWHISLSTWFRDYLYFPLGGNRTSRIRWYRNVAIVFLVSGLWHGANWTFLVWGGLHGFYLVVGSLTSGLRTRMSKFMRLDAFPGLCRYGNVAITFTLVTFAWIFFRANSLSDACLIISRLGKGVWSGFSFIYMELFAYERWENFKLDTIFTQIDIQVIKEYIKREIMLGQSSKAFLQALFFIAVMEIVHLKQRHGSMRHMFRSKPWYVRWAIYYALVLSILMFGVFNQSQFIYFQF